MNHRIAKFLQFLRIREIIFINFRLKKLFYHSEYKHNPNHITKGIYYSF